MSLAEQILAALRVSMTGGVENASSFLFLPTSSILDMSAAQRQDDYSVAVGISTSANGHIPINANAFLPLLTSRGELRDHMQQFENGKMAVDLKVKAILETYASMSKYIFARFR